MFKRGNHRAPRGCRNHLDEIATLTEDIRIMSRLIERATAERMAAEADLRALRTEFGVDAPTEVLSVAQIRAQMRRTAPVVVPVVTEEGSTMLLPVGNNQARKVKRQAPSWARAEGVPT
jgi:hypothetical protein